MKQIMGTDKTVTMNSLEIAELTGKSHGNVMRDIRNMFEELEKDAITFESIYKDTYNRDKPCYKLDKLHTETLILGYSAKLRMKVLVRLNELEQKNQTPAIPQTYAEALQLAADQAKQLELAAPKVAFVDKYVAADSGSKGFRQVAKLLNANEKEFREFLKDRKIMYRLNSEWMPYQQHIEAGRFEVKGGIADNDHVYNSALFTPKGINWIAGLWAQHKLAVKLEY